MVVDCRTARRKRVHAACLCHSHSIYKYIVVPASVRILFRERYAAEVNVYRRRVAGDLANAIAQGIVDVGDGPVIDTRHLALGIVGEGFGGRDTVVVGHHVSSAIVARSSGSVPIRGRRWSAQIGHDS
jgi:hypothetical protein